MILRTTFYSKNACTKVTKCTTLHEAIVHAQSKKATKVVLQPPQSGNQEMDSDVENIPDELPNQEDEFELFELPGEMEIEDEVEESDDDKEEEVIQPKRRKHSHGHPDSKWKQTTTFFKELLLLAKILAKILLLYDFLNASLIQFGIFDKNLSIDEAMMPYFGRHSCKMFIRGKPIHFRYKLWCLCGSNGYLYKLSIYMGKVPNSAENSAPLGTRIVKNMVNIIGEHSQPAKHPMFFDNFFTSYRLGADLIQRDIKFIGNVGENRLAGACKVMTSSKELSGAIEAHFITDLTVKCSSGNGMIIPLLTLPATLEHINHCKKFHKE